MNESKPSAPESPAKEQPIAAPQDRVAGDDQQSLSSGATSRSTPSGESPAVAASIKALLAEARGYLEGLELADRIDAALAAKEQPEVAMPDVKLTSEWVESERRYWLEEAACAILPYGFLLRAALCASWLNFKEQPGEGIYCCACGKNIYTGEPTKLIDFDEWEAGVRKHSFQKRIAHASCPASPDEQKG